MSRIESSIICQDSLNQIKFEELTQKFVTISIPPSKTSANFPVSELLIACYQCPHYALTILHLETLQCIPEILFLPFQLKTPHLVFSPMKAGISWAAQPLQNRAHCDGDDVNRTK
jgi:hypothetical protein